LLALPAGIVVVVTGAIYFADRDMKTADNFFRGFPVLWNFAAFYIDLLQPAEWLTAIIVVLLAVLTFAPIKFLHPLRVTRLRGLNIVLLALWAALAVIAVTQDLAPSRYVTWALVLIAVYFFGVGLLPRKA
jgi:phosphatidylcholine synthase